MFAAASRAKDTVDAAAKDQVFEGLVAFGANEFKNRHFCSLVPILSQDVTGGIHNRFQILDAQLWKKLHHRPVLYASRAKTATPA